MQPYLVRASTNPISIFLIRVGDSVDRKSSMGKKAIGIGGRWQECQGWPSTGREAETGSTMAMRKNQPNQQLSPGHLASSPVKNTFLSPQVFGFGSWEINSDGDPLRKSG